ncbi:glycosyl hydrolase family 18 protein [Jatrophihabitans endophyticus]|uniref:glycosyl hydrolase family 18 protein n=1 Tax=Jatrophihabitans endophyticus TaxID=1206085 RepID=UPI0019E9D1D3|nr:glycosyl hydrolase family 18 protein [Jatrophihabitans endophyticus]MBE7187352.1 hydrolase [Jatrophihabitans endophyticus]
MSTPRARRAGAAVVAGAVAVLVASGMASPASAARHPLAVTGFQGSWNAPADIDHSRHALTTVGVDGVTIASSGASVEKPGPPQTRQLTRAHHDHLRAELLVSNFSDRIEDFSEPVAHALLGHRAHVRAVAAALAADVRRQGWDGISVDLESLRSRDRAGLTAFVRRLRADLPARASLSICVMAFTRPGDYARAGYDLSAIARSVGRVVLMTYDQHGPWENTPGPVGALTWQRASLAAARRFVPARQVDLGVAEYGYAWRPHSNDQLSVRKARRLAGSRARWDAKVGEWTASLADGSTLWWSDARSYRARVALARSKGLHGVAVWDLALGDPIR